MGLVFFVTSSQGFIHAWNISTNRERIIAFFFWVYCFWMAELCTEYSFLMIVANETPEMMSQRKLDFFSCIVIHGPKKHPTSLLWKVQHLKEKSRAKNFLARVMRAVRKIYLCEKNFGGWWHFKLNFELNWIATISRVGKETITVHWIHLDQWPREETNGNPLNFVT